MELKTWNVQEVREKTRLCSIVYALLIKTLSIYHIS